MKKKLSVLLVVVLVLATVLSGCGGGEDTVELKMATGGTGGTYYGYSGIIAQALADVVTITPESTGASMQNVQYLQTGESQIAIIQNDVMSYAYTGTDLWAASNAEAYTDFSAVMACYPETVQIIAKKSITSIDQLKGKGFRRRCRLRC